MIDILHPNQKAAQTGGSVLVERCQICGSTDLQSILFLGYLPPVNTMNPIGSRPNEQPAYPAELLHCRVCSLVQLGLIVDPAIIFPPHYAYTSGTTRILRENFAELYREVMQRFPLGQDDLVVDIGSNDGTLLGNFQKGGHRVCGVEPTNAHKIAVAAGIPVINAFFGPESAAEVRARYGEASLVTAANVFAHIEDVHQIVDSLLSMLKDDGIFISESHYLASLMETLQYDTVYHEHLRYYSLSSLKHLLEMHGMEVIHARKIPTHGGSIRVYAARAGRHPVSEDVAAVLRAEQEALTPERFDQFRRRVSDSKLDLLALVHKVRRDGSRIYAIGAPSRASTLVNYVGLDESMLECVLEIAGSYKIGKYMPGTLIPVVEERRLFDDQPEYALLLSWHIGEELAAKLQQLGFRGKFICPLPAARIL
jgi:C-methyltransferase-like protein/methyltransferase family protein/putative zinc binding protein